jgi:glutamate/tyrosine decarboxylase-like PLP-dependent enzyme
MQHDSSHSLLTIRRGEHRFSTVLHCFCHQNVLRFTRPLHGHYRRRTENSKYHSLEVGMGEIGRDWFREADFAAIERDFYKRENHFMNYTSPMNDSEGCRRLLSEAASRALQYLETVSNRCVSPSEEALGNLKRLGGSLPERAEDALSILKLLDEIGSPATVATAGGRYFGFVVGGALPATVAAHWLAGAWDQNASMSVLSPVGAYLEEVALAWLLDLLHLPRFSGGGFVTGGQMANFTCLAAARHSVLRQAGWDVENDGLFGAPPVTVIVGEEVHATVFKTLAMLGLGKNRVVRVPVDEQGRMRADSLPLVHGPTIICAQAGNVNTGAFDPFMEICESAHAAGAWVHVDGAFGLWAAASEQYNHLTAGAAAADSWAVDAHKWLNVPQDSGIAIVRNPDDLKSAMSITAAYLNTGQQREPMQYVPESSRRARGIEVWTALRALGRKGVADLIERTCRYARIAADRLTAEGFTVLNAVVLNQVLVSFGDAETTARVIHAIQQEGTCWCGSTVWHGTAAMRISISSWATQEDDLRRSLAAIIRTAAEVTARRT